MVPLRVCALIATVALFVSGCGSSADSAEPTALDDPSSVVEVNAFATELIRDHGIWPDTVDARRLFILNQALYETWAVFDGTASGVIPDEGHREAAATFDALGVDTALVAAATQVFEELFDDSESSLAEIEAFGVDQGVEGTEPGTGSPAELGARIAMLVLAEHELDGSGEEFFYRVPPTAEVVQTEPDPTAWQPLLIPTGTVRDPDGRPIIGEGVDSLDAQVFETQHWGDVETFALSDPAQMYPAAPPPRTVTQEPGPYIDEVRTIAASPANLDDEARAQVAAWTAEHSALTWNEIARSLIESTPISGDDAIKALFSMHAAIHDTYVVAWGAKREYMSPRPVTEVRHLVSDDEAFDVAGDTVAAQDWIPYQDPLQPSPPSPTDVAEHVAAAGAAGKVLSEFVDDELAFSREIEAVEADWMIGPLSPITLSWLSYDAMMAGVSAAVTDGGIAFSDDVAAGLVLGERVGPEVYRQSVKLFRSVE
jgi:hypothetical protein